MNTFFISIFSLAASSRYPSDWHFWVFITIFIAACFAYMSWQAKCRRSALEQVAPTIGFLWLDSMPPWPDNIAFLHSGLGGEFSNAMSGSRAGCKVIIFDYEYETGMTPRTERTHAQTIAAFNSASTVLPAFQFGPESVMHKMSTVGSTKQFKFETALASVPARVGHYLLRSVEQSAANHLFDPEMLSFFNGLGLPQEPWLLEGNQEWLLVWQHNNIVPGTRYSWFLDQTSTIAATVFGYARTKLALPQGTSICSSCGVSLEPAEVSPFALGIDAVSTGLTDSLAGALAYITILPAIGFLLFEPYNKNGFVRFHAFQCIFLNIAFSVLGTTLISVPKIGLTLLFVVSPVEFILWIVAIFKAYRGQKFKVPVIGDLAEKYGSNA